MTRTALCLTALLALASARAAAQTPLVVTALDSASGTPVTDALGRDTRARNTVAADRLGRIRFAALARPAVVLVLAIGFAPETLAVGDSATEMVVRLRGRPIGLAAVTVSGDAGTDLTPAATGRWVLSPAAMAMAPPAIEPDPLRALALLPAVAFSSPLSARPIIRGYDAAESGTRLDGFELVNPYHIGRVFSAFPADFTKSIAVTVVPHRAADASALSGVVDLVGVSTAARGPADGGVALSPASLAAWGGWKGPVPGFAGGRLASLNVVSDVVGDQLGYAFNDGYLRAALPWPGGWRTDLSLYGSRDELGDMTHSGARWSNVLAGQRTRVVDRPALALDVEAAFNRFVLDGRDIEARFTRLDITNRFGRVSAGLDAHGTTARLGWRAGAVYARRDVVNRIQPSFGSDFPATAGTRRLDELQAHGSVAMTIGGATLDAGARLDASTHASAWQPRARLTLPLARGVIAAIAVARSARLYQFVTDPQPEPTLAFYDFWMIAGASGVPLPRVDHAAVELDVGHGGWAVHVGAYASRGSGLGELRPATDLRDTTAFRFGDSRTGGLEVRVARGSTTPGGASWAVSYALGWSQRRWDDGVWRPWRLDQRHRVRAQTDAPLARRWRAFALAEFRSAQPVNRVSEVYFRSFTEPGDSLSGRPLFPGYLYAPEGSVRGNSTLWVDVGSRWSIAGPWGLRTTVGLSVTNLVFGPVAPIEPVDPLSAITPPATSPAGQTAGVRYERRFSLPPVPSVTVRVEF